MSGWEKFYFSSLSGPSYHPSSSYLQQRQELRQKLRAKSLSNLICSKSWQAVQIWEEELFESNAEFQ